MVKCDTNVTSTTDWPHLVALLQWNLSELIRSGAMNYETHLLYPSVTSFKLCSAHVR